MENLFFLIVIVLLLFISVRMHQIVKLLDLKRFKDQEQRLELRKEINYINRALSKTSDETQKLIREVCREVERLYSKRNN